MLWWIQTLNYSKSTLRHFLTILNHNDLLSSSIFWAWLLCQNMCEVVFAPSCQDKPQPYVSWRAFKGEHYNTVTIIIKPLTTHLPKTWCALYKMLHCCAEHNERPSCMYFSTKGISFRCVESSELRGGAWPFDLQRKRLIWEEVCVLIPLLLQRCWEGA